MTTTEIQLSEEQFAALFPLRTNYLNPGASWQNADGDGCLFETYGDELAFVDHCDHREIWTLVDDDDGGQSILSGFHIVNRIGYLVSTVATPNGLKIHVRLDSRNRDDLIPSNHRRAMRVEHVLSWCKDWDTGREGLIDLLTDARHWCDEHGESFAQLNRLAHQHYIAERNHKED